MSVLPASVAATFSAALVLSCGGSGATSAQSTAATEAMVAPDQPEPNQPEPSQPEPGQPPAPRVRMRVGAISISGPLERDAAREVVRRHWGQYRLCYHEGLERNPHLEGRVGVRVAVDAAGETTSVRDGGSDIPDNEFKHCILDAFVSLSFPATGANVRMTIPLAFTTQ